MLLSLATPNHQHSTPGPNTKKITKKEISGVGKTHFF